MRLKFCMGLALLLISGTAGCGGFFARRMAQAPNRYPSWLAPAAPVELAFDRNLLACFPARFADVGPPSARLRYRVVEPADYQLEILSTNWLKGGRSNFKFTLSAVVPARPNAWTPA